MQKNIQKKFFVSEIFASELVALNCNCLLQTNKYLHGRKTNKIFGRYQKISRNPTFAYNHA